MTKTRCNKHPRYKGIRPPSHSCHDCVMVYMTKLGMWKVLSEGHYCANVLYNYKQCVNRTFCDGDAQVMAERQKKFDDSYTAFTKQIDKNKK